MDNEKMGKFILELRKSKQMTQKDLAARLNITDKAVSKWERGLSCPDISLLSSIAEILGVTTSELLNGERSESTAKDIEVSIDNALYYADKTTKKRVKSLQNVCAFVFSVLFIIGIVVCIICDIAISGALTWSLIAISSIVFSWFMIFPIIKYAEKGIAGSLAALSILIIPYLYVLNKLIETNGMIFTIGIRMSVISIVFLWIIFAVFKILKERKIFAAAISVLILIPVQVLINVTLSKIFSEPLIDVWDVLDILIIMIVAIVLFAFDYMKRKKLQDMHKIGE